MGNSHSQEQSEPSSPPLESEGHGIGRVQAVTGAKAAEPRAKPRGPKANVADYPRIQARHDVGLVVAHLLARM